jgi:hypothetical protein
MMFALDSDLACLTDLTDPEHAPDGAALARIRNRLTQGQHAGSGAWTRYCAAIGLSLRTANARIARAEGRSYDKRAQLVHVVTNCASLPEPPSDPEIVSPATPVASTPSAPDAVAIGDTATPATPPKRKRSHRRTRPKPVVDHWAKEPDEAVLVPMALADAQLHRRMTRYFQDLQPSGLSERRELDQGAVREMLDHLLAYIDDAERDEGLYACERLGAADLQRLRREAATGRPLLPKGLSAEERAALPAPTPAQTLALRAAYEALPSYEAAAVERKTLRDRLTGRQVEALVDLFEDADTSAAALRLALAPAELARQALPMVTLLAHLRACDQVDESAVAAWVEVATPDEQQQAGLVLAEVAELRRHLWEAIHARRRAAALAEPQEAQAEEEPRIHEDEEGAAPSARERFAASVRRAREQGEPSYLPSRFSLDSTHRFR